MNSNLLACNARYVFCKINTRLKYCLRYLMITTGKEKTVYRNQLLSLPVDTGRKLNVHETFRRHPGRLLNVLCTFTLRPVSTGLSRW